MCDSAIEMLELVHRPPEDLIYYNIEDQYLTPLGFTIYRTDYSVPEHAWEAFLQLVTTSFRDEISRAVEHQQHIAEEQEATGKVMNLLQIDGRSDVDLLNGRTMDELRTIFREQVGGTPVNGNDTTMQYFLLADTEVFDAASRGESWVKIVEVRYDSTEHEPNPLRSTGRNDYLGWIKIAINSLMWIRATLDISDLEAQPFRARFGSSIADQYPVVENGKNVDY